MNGRTVKFHKIFDIPTSETLIRTFPCALKSEILLQGTFYVSANYFCFYARLANKRKTIKIPIRTIMEITREKTAIFFPNAIGIRTDECRYVFGSILSRETMLKLLLDLWKAALRSQAVDGAQLPTVQALETVRRIIRSSSDSDLASLQPTGAAVLLARQKGPQNGDLLPISVPHARPQLLLRPNSQATASSSSPAQTPAAPETPVQAPVELAAFAQPRARCWSQVLLQNAIFLKSHLSFLLTDNRMALGCGLIVICLVYVLYLAYQIHIIQQTISEKLEELLQSSTILSPLVHR